MVLFKVKLNFLSGIVLTEFLEILMGGLFIFMTLFFLNLFTLFFVGEKLYIFLMLLIYMSLKDVFF